MNLSIRQRFILIVLLASVVLVATFVFTRRHNLATWSAKVNDTGTAAVTYTAEAIDQYFEEVEQVVANVAAVCSNMHRDHGYEKAGDFQRLIDSFHKNNESSGVEELFLGAQADDRIIDSANWTSYAPEETATSRVWYWQAVGMGHTALTFPFVNLRDGKARLAVTTPFYGEGMKLLGVLGATVSTGEIARFLKTYLLYKKGFIILAAPDGTLLAFPDETALMNENLQIPSDQVSPTLAQMGLDMTKKLAGHRDFKYRNEEWRGFYTPTRKGLLVALAYPLSELDTIAGRLVWQQTFLAMLLFATFALFLVPIFLAINRFTTNLSGTSDKIHSRLLTENDIEKASYALGELTRDIQKQLDHTKIIEFKNFLTSLHSTLSILGNQQQELTAYGQEMQSLNALLEDSNRKLERRELLWKKTLEASETITGQHDYEADLARISEVLHETSGAWAIAIVIPAQSSDQMIFYSCNTDGDKIRHQKFYVPRENSIAGRVFERKITEWLPLAAVDPNYFKLFDPIVSEVYFPLLISGKTVGVLIVSFDSLREENPELLETLLPVTSTLSGLISVVAQQREIRSSYHYLTDQLHFVTTPYLHESPRHLRRVSLIGGYLADTLGFSTAERRDLVNFARLHDIGKIKVPEEILSRNGPLSPSEMELVKQHTLWGAELIGNATWLAMARDICAAHHEAWDGSGYPLGLAGNAIPISAQIIHLADVYESLRSEKPYKGAMSHESAVRRILEGDDRTHPEQFGPELLSLFRYNHRIIESIYKNPKQGEDDGQSER